VKNILFASLLVLTISCASPVKVGFETPSDSSTVVSLWPTWVSETKKGLVANLNLRNNNPQKLIVDISDIVCFQGNVQGNLKRIGDDQPAFQSYLDSGTTRVNYISFEQREKKTSEVICEPAVNSSGDFSFVVKKVYTNPKGDRQTRGNVAQENIIWVYKSVNN
jgi:hypothetical protein